MITILYFILAVFGFIYAAGFGATFIIYSLLAQLLKRSEREGYGAFLTALIWPVFLLKRR